jgi:hypothetical protein
MLMIRLNLIFYKPNDGLGLNREFDPMTFPSWMMAFQLLQIKVGTVRDCDY